MASPVVPATLIGRLAARRHQAAQSGRRVAVSAWAARLAAAAADHATTFIACGAMVLGAFEAWRPAGWMVLGALLPVLEWKVRG